MKVSRRRLAGPFERPGFRDEDRIYPSPGGRNPMAGPPSPPPPPPPPPSNTPIPPPGAGWAGGPPRSSMLDMGSLQTLFVTWGRILGFLLLFLGTLVAVVAGSVAPDCYPTGGCTGYGGDWAWAALIGAVLWVIALFFLGGSSGLQLMRGLKAPSGGTPEEYRWVLTERWFNFLMVALSIVLLWFLLSSILMLHPGFATGG